MYSYIASTLHTDLVFTYNIYTNIYLSIILFTYIFTVFSPYLFTSFIYLLYDLVFTG